MEPTRAQRTPPPTAWYANAHVEVVVNGESRAVADGATVAALLGDLRLDMRTVAVERNREIVPRAEYATTPLRAGDHLEIVTFVGGG
jgi:sulfur carrier protein